MSDAIKIFSGATESDKKVGINIPATMTTTPSAVLYVNGDIESSSEITTPILTISEDGVFTLGTGGELDAGALVATDDKIKIGGGALPSNPYIFDMDNSWLIRSGGITGIHTTSGYEGLPKANVIVPIERLSFSGQGGTASNYLQAWLKYICANYQGYERCVFIGPILANTSGYIICLIYDTSVVNSSGLPRYSNGFMNWYAARGGEAYLFGTSEYTFTVKTISAS